MIRMINSVLIGLLFGAIPLALMWLSGFDFVRGKTLGFTSFCTVVIFFVAFAIAVSDAKETP